MIKNDAADRLSTDSDRSKDAEPKISFTRVGVCERQGMRPSMEDAAAVHHVLKSSRSERFLNTNGNRAHKKASISHLELSSHLHAKTRSFFGVFDGHGGSCSADFVAENLPVLVSKSRLTRTDPEKALVEEFQNCDDQLREYLNLEHCGEPESRSGCTAVTALIEYTHFKNICNIYCANLGDSRCILVRKDGSFKALSRDHVPSDEIEKRRIEAAGGEVKPARIQSELLRVLGVLSVTRAFGDFDFKMPTVEQFSRGEPIQEDLILSVPEIQHTVVNQQTDLCLILACDGVWNSFSNEQAASFVKQGLEKLKSKKESVENDIARCNAVAEDLVSEAIERGSTDNCTAMVLLLKPTIKGDAQRSTTSAHCHIL